MQGLSGKAALVTGGAKNIGKAISRRLAREGVSVMIVGRSVALGAALAEEIRAGGGRADNVACDVSNPEDVRAAVAKTIDAFGALDIVVNNAAATYIIRAGDEHSIVEEDLETFEQFVKVGVYGPFLFAKYAVPEMVKRGGGVFVNISSIAAVKAQSGSTAYGPTKAALESLTNQIAVNYGEKNVRAVAIRVGMIRTDENHLIHDHPTVGPAMRKSQMLTRSGAPDDIASAVAFVASDEGSFMTGTVMTVDGGYTVMQTMPDTSAVFADAKKARGG